MSRCFWIALIASWSTFVATCVVFGVILYEVRERLRGPSSRPGPPQ